MVAPDLYDLVFREFLKLPDCRGPAGWGCITGDLGHDFIFGLFLPHVVIFIFLFLATRGLGGHRGLEMLTAAGAYVFIMYIGFYPLVASLSVLWFILALGISGFYFFFGKIFHPTRSSAVFDITAAAATKHMAKQKIKRKIQEDIDELRKRRDEAERAGNIRRAEAIEKEILRLERKLRDL